MGQPEHIDVTDLDEADRAKVLDFVVSLHARRPGAAEPHELAAVRARLDSLPDHDDEDGELRPEFVTDLDQRQAEDKVERVKMGEAIERWS